MPEFLMYQSDRFISHLNYTTDAGSDSFRRLYML